MKKSFYFLLTIALSSQANIDISTVVIPAAGFGTRFLPITKAIPKELLPLGNKPIYDYIVNEAKASGMKKIVSVISKRKSAIIDYFDLKKSEDFRSIDKAHIIKECDESFKNLSFEYVNQSEQLGLGHAIFLTREAIGEEYFGIMLPDEVIFSDDEDPALAQIIKIAKRENASVIAVQEVPDEKVSNYGIVKIKEDLGNGLYELESMVEKPSIEHAPSNLAIIGRYILSPKIFNSLSVLFESRTSGELQLTDAIFHMMKLSGEKVFAYKVCGERHDTGIPSGWAKAVIANSFKDSELKSDIINYVNEKINQDLHIN